MFTDLKSPDNALEVANISRIVVEYRVIATFGSNAAYFDTFSLCNGMLDAALFYVYDTSRFDPGAGTSSEKKLWGMSSLRWTGSHDLLSN